MTPMNHFDSYKKKKKTYACSGRQYLKMHLMTKSFIFIVFHTYRKIYLCGINLLTFLNFNGILFLDVKRNNKTLIIS